MNVYSIGDFAKRTGVTVRALRFYDQKGLLTPSYVSEAGQRFYNDQSIVNLQKIVTLKYLGYSLEEIQQLLQDNSQTIIASLQFQKLQLEQKRAHMDRIIGSLETAISIGEKSTELEPNLFLMVIHTLLTENEQRKYLAQFLPENLVDRLYDFFGSNLIELNRQYIEMAIRIKNVYLNPVSDEQLKSYIEQLFMLIPQSLVEELAEAFKEHNVQNLNEWLFPSPFTKEEEEWVIEQADRFGLYGGDNDE